jgi:DNA polymerase III alpha subunit
MITDKFGNLIFQDKDIFNLIYQGHSDKLDKIYTDQSVDIQQLFENFGVNPKILDSYEDQKFFDEANQTSWFIPQDYCPNLVEYLYGCCTTDEQKDRVSEELTAFIEHNMFDLLFCLKYIVDTLRENNVVWGVGRGSSVASYVLYLIGVHKIDSLKYNLDWREFLR